MSSGLGYNPYRASDGKFASGPGDANKGDKPITSEPKWPKNRQYGAKSTDVKDHSARARFHMHRAEHFSNQVATAKTEEDRQKFLDKAKTSATHAATCARRAERVGRGTAGAFRAQVYERQAREHASRAQVARLATTEHPLYDKLQSDSARPMIPEAKRQFDGDPDKDLIAERGKFVSGEGKSKMLGAEGECHWNTAKLFRDKKIDAVVVGYAHNPEAGWHQHTWGEKDGKIVETTASNLSSSRYFGARLSKEESARFSEWALKNPPGGGVVRAGKKGKL